MAIQPGDKTVRVGQTIQIKWESNDLSSVNFSLYKQGQKFKDLFTRQSSNGTNQTTWVPTQDLVDTDVPYSIRIEMSNNASIFDSTQTFYVVAQNVVVKPIIPSVSLKLNTTSISKGNSAVLTWNSTQASSVNISGIGAVELNGSKTVSPTESTSYTATAISSDGNQASSTVSLSVSEPNIPVPVITLFTVNKTSIELGESVSIMWNTENATSVTIVDDVSYSKNSGPVGEITVTPTMPTTTYTITAFGQQGKNATSTLTVSTKILQPSLSVTYQGGINTVVVKDNQLLNTTKISWNAINLGMNDKLYINDQLHPASGDKEVPERSSSYQSSYEYRFVIKDSVTNQIKVEKSMPITVKFEDSPLQAIITGFSEMSGNTQILEGNPIILRWTTDKTAVVDLEVDGIITQYAAQNPSGINVGVMDKDSKTFTLTAWNDANRNSTKDVRSISLIRSLKPAPEIVTFTASNKTFNNSYDKVSVTLNWKVINETDNIRIIYAGNPQGLQVSPEGTTTLEVPNKSAIKIEAVKSGKTTATQQEFIDLQVPEGPSIVFFNVRGHTTENPVKIYKGSTIQFDFDVKNSERILLSFEGNIHEATGKNGLELSSNGIGGVAQLEVYEDYYGTKRRDSKILTIEMIDVPKDPVISLFDAVKKAGRTDYNVDVSLTWNVLNFNSSTDILKISYTSSTGINNLTVNPLPSGTTYPLVVKNNSDIKLSLYRGNELKQEKSVPISVVYSDPIINVFRFSGKVETDATFEYSEPISVDYSVSNAEQVIIKLDGNIYLSTKILSNKINLTSISADSKHVLDIIAYEFEGDELGGRGKSSTSQLTFSKRLITDIPDPKIILFYDVQPTYRNDLANVETDQVYSVIKWNISNLQSTDSISVSYMKDNKDVNEPVQNIAEGTKSIVSNNNIIMTLNLYRSMDGKIVRKAFESLPVNATDKPVEDAPMITSFNINGHSNDFSSIENANGLVTYTTKNAKSVVLNNNGYNMGLDPGSTPSSGRRSFTINSTSAGSNTIQIVAYENENKIGRSDTKTIVITPYSETKLPVITSFTNNSSQLSEVDSSKNVTGIKFSWSVDNFNPSTDEIYIEQSPPNSNIKSKVFYSKSASGTTGDLSMINGSAVRLIVRRNSVDVTYSDSGSPISAIARIASYPAMEGTITINSSEYIDANTVKISYTYNAINAKQLRVVTSNNPNGDIIAGVGDKIQSFNGTKSGIVVQNNSQLILYGTDGNNKEEQLITPILISVAPPNNAPFVHDFSMSGTYAFDDSSGQMGYIKLSANDFKNVKDVKIIYISLNGVQKSEIWVTSTNASNPPEKIVTAQLNSTLTLEATDTLGKAVTLLSQKVLFDVPQPLIPSVKSFTATPSQPKVGEYVTLEWKTENVDSVLFDHNGKQIPEGPNGNRTIQINSRTVFKLIPIVSGVAKVELMEDLEVNPIAVKIVPKINEFKESTGASTFYKGDTIALIWSTTDAYQIKLTSSDPMFSEVSFGGSGAANSTTNVTLPNKSVVNYTLTVTSKDGESVSKVISFNLADKITPPPVELPVINSFTGPSIVTAGVPATFSWSAKNAATVKIWTLSGKSIIYEYDAYKSVNDSASLTWNTNENITENNDVVYLTVTSPTGQSVSNSINIDIRAVPLLTPSISFFSGPTNVIAGTVNTYNWAITNTSTVTLSTPEGPVVTRTYNTNSYVSDSYAYTFLQSMANTTQILTLKATSPDGISLEKTISVVVNPSYAGGGVYDGGGCPDPMMSVLMSDKTYKLAKDLRPGDEIYTMNESTGEYGIYKIKYAFLTQQPKLKFTFEDNTHAIVSTSHGFLLIGDKWAGASDIMIGDTIQCLSGNNKTIATIEDMGIGNVIMIEVEDAHTYILEDLISHNMKKASFEG